MGETAPGKIVNLVANDVNRFDIISVFIHHMWSAPLSAMVILIMLYLRIGWSAFVGMAIIFLVVPFQGKLIILHLRDSKKKKLINLFFFHCTIAGYLGKLSSKFRLQTSIKTDERVRLMDEIISGVQVIKMYAWEKPFCAMVELARRLELKVVRKSSYIRGIYMTFNMFTTRAALFGTLITMMLRGQALTIEEVFVYMSYFNLMAQTMSSMFVRGIAEIAECKVAVNRLQNFLMYEEFESSNVSNGNANLSTSTNSVSTNTTPKPDLPYIDEDVNYEERSNDKNRQSFVMQASDMLKLETIETNGKQNNSVK